MCSISKKIVEYIKINRVSSTEVTDAMGKSGALHHVNSLNRGNFSVGEVKWIYAYNESNYSIHEQIKNVPQGSIIIADGFQVNHRALFGELVTKYLIRYCRVSGIVVKGNLRDANNIIRQNYPVWCEGTTPVGGFNDKREKDKNLEEIIEKEKLKYDGAIAVCDDTGIAIIEKFNINGEFLDKLQQMELQEDIWFECIDTRKWNTFDTVCLKKYLGE